VLCTWVKLLTDLQILGSELRLAAGLHRTRWGSYSAISHYKGKGRRQGKERVGNRKRNGTEGKDEDG